MRISTSLLAVVLVVISFRVLLGSFVVNVAESDRAQEFAGAVGARLDTFVEESHAVELAEPDELTARAATAQTESVPVVVVAPVQEEKHPDASMLRAEVKRLERRVAWLETELDLCGSEVTQGPVGRWLAMLRPEERPGRTTLHRVAEYLRPYPVELSIEEGLWIADRIESDDWRMYGPTIDEALITFLGPIRLSRDLPEDALRSLREEWAEEGFFSE